ncbi:hypothetical protein BKA80DRAFT_261260 [Phyllosticta citrichinensis]
MSLQRSRSCLALGRTLAGSGDGAASSRRVESPLSSSYNSFLQHGITANLRIQPDPLLSRRTFPRSPSPHPHLLPVSFPPRVAIKSSKPTKALLPPSPPGAWPLIGPLPQFISAAKAHRLHLLVEQWIREYGKEEGLVRVRIAGVEVVHVGKDEAVKVRIVQPGDGERGGRGRIAGSYDC